MFVSIYHKDLPAFKKGWDLLEHKFLLDNRNDNYDNGVAKLNQFLPNDWDILHFVDNDCFITDTTYIKQRIEDFAKSDLGFVSYFENGWGNKYSNYTFDSNTIATVHNQKFIDTYPFMKPSWENAMMMFKKEAWDKITDYSDMNKYLPELWDKGIKFGVSQVEPRLKYSHKGDGFFHVGNLMKYYYMLENGQDIPLDEISKPRIGYFQSDGLFPEQTKHYPDFRKEWRGLSE